MKLTGTITTFDSAVRKGIIRDPNGQDHIIEPGSFRRTVKLKQGDTVRFNSFNLYAGPTARDVEPELHQTFEYFLSDLPR